LGIGGFHIADFDTFDIANFNRQAGATVSTLGLTKSSVLAGLARGINPEVELETFDKGVTEENIDAFLAGIDLYVDGLDFFAFSARQMVFAACAKRGIPAITVAPLGMGAALLNFMPGCMTFEEYFRWAGCSEHEMALRFLIGLSPAMLQRVYLMDRTKVDLKSHKGPSTPMACELCAGIAATEALKVLLNRGNVISAPHGVHFDAFRNKLKKTWRPWGNGNPIQRLAIIIARSQLRANE
jgi:molybdopterin/thiamine biosynthesis adenylyltransferase